MPRIITATTTTGATIEFVDERKNSGGMKDIYHSPDKSYVAAFFRDSKYWLAHDRAKYANAKDRIKTICDVYRQRVFNQPGGDYWGKIFCWPTAVMEHEEKGLGIAVPFYDQQYFFEFGSRNGDNLNIKGKEKEGKWFAAPKLRNRFLAKEELGDWLNHIRISLMLARGVRKLHALGLAHSDLSYKNCLVNPILGNACIIDIDGLVVPQKFPPDVIGTDDFIAPEVLATSKLPFGDSNRKLPSILTDRYALAVLIYMYLLYRHPLKGGKYHGSDDAEQEEFLSLGEKALFIEHPSDPSNRVNLQQADKWELPWADTKKLPYALTGPYLARLFNKVFIDGLHNPDKRPTADEWETALVKTVDLIQPCQNDACPQKWFVFDNTTQPACPFCGAPFRGKLPILNLYSSRTAGNYMPDNHRLMVYSNQSLFPWHINKHIFPNENISEIHKGRVGYFVYHDSSWWLVNENMPGLMAVDGSAKIPIAPGGKVELKDGLKLLFSSDSGGRLAVVQMVTA